MLQDGCGFQKGKYHGTYRRPCIGSMSCRFTGILTVAHKRSQDGSHVQLPARGVPDSAFCATSHLWSPATDVRTTASTMATQSDYGLTVHGCRNDRLISPHHFVAACGAELQSDLEAAPSKSSQEILGIGLPFVKICLGPSGRHLKSSNPTPTPKAECLDSDTGSA